MDRWKSDPRIAARGFKHAYDAVVDDGNGEDLFLELVDQLITPTTDLLDVGVVTAISPPSWQAGFAPRSASIGRRV